MKQSEWLLDDFKIWVQIKRIVSASSVLFETHYFALFTYDVQEYLKNKHQTATANKRTWRTGQQMCGVEKTASRIYILTSALDFVS